MALQRLAGIDVEALLRPMTFGHLTLPAIECSPAMGYSAVGLRHACMDLVLRQAMGSGRIAQVRCVRRDPHKPETTCILHRDGAGLSA